MPDHFDHISPADGKQKDDADARQSNDLWGGRFADGPDAIMMEINASIGIDKRLFREDIAGSRAHATMLAATHIISNTDRDAILKGLDQVEHEIAGGKMTFDPALEDIHMHVEARLKEIIGEPAGRLHTARSRNDQVATDVRLWAREQLTDIITGLIGLQKALIDQAEQHAALVMPGFTHLQTAQPVTLGHHLLAYVEMLGRDIGRLIDCQDRLNEMPLGAAALAGTSFPIKRELTAKMLGFDQPMGNSLDAVSARDFILELISGLSISAMHMSRLADELVLWASAQFGFIKLSDAFSTGSSIMPQKRNPDAAELIRAKVGSISAQYQSVLMMMKGLPLAYSKDMQEDKAPLFRAVDDFQLCVAAMTGMISDLKPQAAAMRTAAEYGFSTATDLADWLVRAANIPFRDSHHITGTLVKLAEDRSCQLWDLSLEDMQAVEARITNDVFSVLSVDASVASRTSYGGTAPAQVREQIADWRLLIAILEEQHEDGEVEDV